MATSAPQPSEQNNPQSRPSVIPQKPVQSALHTFIPEDLLDRDSDARKQIQHSAVPILASFIDALQYNAASFSLDIAWPYWFDTFRKSIATIFLFGVPVSGISYHVTFHLLVLSLFVSSTVFIVPTRKLYAWFSDRGTKILFFVALVVQTVGVMPTIRFLMMGVSCDKSKPTYLPDETCYEGVHLYYTIFSCCLFVGLIVLSAKWEFITTNPIEMARNDRVYYMSARQTPFGLRSLSIKVLFVLPLSILEHSLSTEVKATVFLVLSGAAIVVLVHHRPYYYYITTATLVIPLLIAMLNNAMAIIIFKTPEQYGSPVMIAYLVALVPFCLLVHHTVWDWLIHDSVRAVLRDDVLPEVPNAARRKMMAQQKKQFPGMLSGINRTLSGNGTTGMKMSNKVAPLGTEGVTGANNASAEEGSCPFGSRKSQEQADQKVLEELDNDLGSDPAKWEGIDTGGLLRPAKVNLDKRLLGLSRSGLVHFADLLRRVRMRKLSMRFNELNRLTSAQLLSGVAGSSGHTLLELDLSNNRTMFSRELNDEKDREWHSGVLHMEKSHSRVERLRRRHARWKQIQEAREQENLTHIGDQRLSTMNRSHTHLAGRNTNSGRESTMSSVSNMSSTAATTTPTTAIQRGLPPSMGSVIEADDGEEDEQSKSEGKVEKENGEEEQSRRETFSDDEDDMIGLSNSQTPESKNDPQSPSTKTSNEVRTSDAPLSQENLLATKNDAVLSAPSTTSYSVASSSELPTVRCPVTRASTSASIQSGAGQCPFSGNATVGAIPKLVGSTASASGAGSNQIYKVARTSSLARFARLSTLPVRPPISFGSTLSTFSRIMDEGEEEEEDVPLMRIKDICGGIDSTIRTCRILQRVCLKKTVLPLNTFLHLTEALMVSNVSELDVSACGLRFNHVKCLIRLLCCNDGERLSALMMRYNAVGERGARLIAKALPAAKRLKFLDIGWNNIGLEGARTIISSIDKYMRLNIDCNTVPYRQYTKLKDELRKIQKEHKANAGGNQFDIGDEALSKVLHGKTLYDALGGEEKIKEIVDRFYVYIVTDPQLSPFFKNISMGRMRHLQSGLLGRILGSNKPYKGRGLKEAHADKGITHDQFDQAASWLLAAAKDTCPNAPKAVIKAFIAKLEMCRKLIVTKDAEKKPSIALDASEEIDISQMDHIQSGLQFIQRFRASTTQHMIQRDSSIEWR